MKKCKRCGKKFPSGGLDSLCENCLEEEQFENFERKRERLKNIVISLAKIRGKK